MLRKLIMTSVALTACILLTAAVPAPAATPAKAPVTATMATPAATQATVPAMAVAPAAPVKAAAKPDSTGSVIGGAVLQILIVVLTLALPIILTPLVTWLLKKMKVENLQTQLMVDGIVDQGVVHGLNYANEQAHKLRDNPVKSAEKLDVATEKALAYLKDSGIVDKGAGYIKDLIEAKLGQTRGDVPTAENADEPKSVAEDAVPEPTPKDDSKADDAKETAVPKEEK